jgi:fatty acid desaturase
MSNAASDLRDQDLHRLDAAEDALLAPVRGTDHRRALSREYFQKRPGRFAAKFIFALAMIAASWVVIALAVSWVATLVAMAVAGIFFAHLVELQHECLHEHAFRSRRLNRVAGFVCGIFMVNSFWHYKHDHLRHHAFLGTSRNREFFNYRFKHLDRPLGFLVAVFHPGRYTDVLRDIGRAWLWRPMPTVPRELDRKRIQLEYRLLSLIIVAAVIASVVSGSWFFVLAWLVPALLIAEPAHFLIEMPEHFGLNTQSNPDVLSNTRTINASKFAQWFTNLNNLHTAHHYHQGVPVAQAVALHSLIADKVVPLEPSYWAFYRKVLAGEIKYQLRDETCMTR